MSKEHAYAYEAGYRDGSIKYELEHCPACKNVADLQEALAENAKLRESLEFANSECEKESLEFLGVRNENAKLRELAERACEMARTFYNLGGTFNDLDDLLCEAAELGVEVDG